MHVGTGIFDDDYIEFPLSKSPHTLTVFRFLYKTLHSSAFVSHSFIINLKRTFPLLYLVTNYRMFFLRIHSLSARLKLLYLILLSKISENTG